MKTHRAVFLKSKHTFYVFVLYYIKMKTHRAVFLKPKHTRCFFISVYAVFLKSKHTGVSLSMYIFLKIRHKNKTAKSRPNAVKACQIFVLCKDAARQSLLWPAKAYMP